MAIDEKRGMADDNGIPWDLPTDRKYYVEKTQTGAVLMGYGTYVEFSGLFHGRTSYVGTTREGQLREGFIKVPDAREFLKNAKQDVWNIGGPRLLRDTLNLVDELYITQIDGDFHATKILPEFKNDFRQVQESEPKTENGMTFRFQIWQNKHKTR